MTAKSFVFHEEARRQLARGVEALARPVATTFGPRGSAVLLERPHGAPLVTRDGATVAREVQLPNRFADLGAQLLKEAASATAEAAGDGTTAATLIARSIYIEGAKLVAAGIDPMELKRGIDTATAAAVRALERRSRSVQGRQEIAQIATVSANGDAIIGALIAEAMGEIGKDGVITVEEGDSVETTLDVVNGMRFDRGFLSPYFVTDIEQMSVALEDPYVLLCEKKISGAHEVLPILEKVAASGRPLLIIAGDVDGGALATLVVNHIRGGIRICAVKAPGFGDRRREQLIDIASVCGGRALTEDLGTQLEELTLEDLGSAKKVKVVKEHTTLINGGGDEATLAARARQIRARVKEATSAYDREKLEERLAALVGGVAVIRIGAASETEMQVKKARVEDALRATWAAVEEGVVPGGGVALLRILPTLEELRLPGEQQHGVKILCRALEEPLRQLARNGGREGGVVVRDVREGMGSFGYNVDTDEYEDLMEAGLLDPTKVIRVALESAASVASLMLTTEVLIVEGSSSAESAYGFEGAR